MHHFYQLNTPIQNFADFYYFLLLTVNVFSLASVVLLTLQDMYKALLMTGRVFSVLKTKLQQNQKCQKASKLYMGE